MIKFIFYHWDWILIVGILLTTIICLINECQVRHLYPNVNAELKNKRFQLMNIRLTDHYLVVGNYRKKVIPYQDIESCEEIEGDMFFSQAGKAIALHLKNGKTVRIARISKHYYKKEYPDFRDKINQQLHIIA